ncbi:MAG: 5'/3'-nucleotidase SurE [Fibrobacterales bacterium]
MRILITNDDGISSGALHALAGALSVDHDIIVIAPATEQSGVGHGFTYLKNLEVEKLTIYPYPCYSVMGTPADCIKFAHFELLQNEKADLVVSGINDGHNTGVACFYSGTVGGAREGILLGIPSIAVSVHHHSEKNNTAGVKWVVDMINSDTFSLLNTQALWNVNLPDLDRLEMKGSQFCAMSMVMYHDDYTLESEGTVNSYSFSGDRPKDQFKEGTDDYLVLDGYASIVPIKTDQTDETFLELQRKIKQ